jgi:hypothetical protein
MQVSDICKSTQSNLLIYSNGDKDSLQAFSSSIAGLLSSRAVLSSVGVGDSSASPTAALILSIIQESAGRIATILFAWRLGTSLEPECKMYRLLADILNDLAFVLDCLSPAFPKPVRVLILSFSSVLRALCGVAAGSAKASLSAHFARWGNLGELNAKDSSQETVISLLGMLVGSVVVQWVTSPFATWTTLILLLSIHLETNRRAVRAVSMRTLNRQRANFVYHHLRAGHVPSPKEVSMQERIFESPGVLRSSSGEALGSCQMGASMSSFLQTLASPHPATKSTTIPGTALTKLLKPFQKANYLMWYEPLSISRKVDVHIALKKDATPLDQLSAWWHAMALADVSHPRDKSSGEGMKSESSTLLERSMASSSALVAKHESALRELGWDLDTGALETGSNPRLTVK